MQTEHENRSFWQVAFSPQSGYIPVFLLTLLITAISGNLIYSFLTDRDNLTASEIFWTIMVLVFLSLIAGFVWENRTVIKVPFEVSEHPELKLTKGFIHIPSNPGVAKTVMEDQPYLEHIWAISAASYWANHRYIFQECQQRGITFHSYIIGEHDPNTLDDYDLIQPTIYESEYLGIEDAIKSALLSLEKITIAVDITGGMKPMTITAFMCSMKHDLRTCYVASQYNIDIGANQATRKSEGKPTVIEYEFKDIPFDLIYDPTKTNE